MFFKILFISVINKINIRKIEQIIKHNPDQSKYLRLIMNQKKFVIRKVGANQLLRRKINLQLLQLYLRTKQKQSGSQIKLQQNQYNQKELQYQQISEQQQKKIVCIQFLDSQVCLEILYLTFLSYKDEDVLKQITTAYKLNQDTGMDSKNSQGENSNQQYQIKRNKVGRDLSLFTRVAKQCQYPLFSKIKQFSSQIKQKSVLLNTVDTISGNNPQNEENIQSIISRQNEKKLKYQPLLLSFQKNFRTMVVNHQLMHNIIGHIIQYKDKNNKTDKQPERQTSNEQNYKGLKNLIEEKLNQLNRQTYYAYETEQNFGQIRINQVKTLIQTKEILIVITNTTPQTSLSPQNMAQTASEQDKQSHLNKNQSFKSFILLFQNQNSLNQFLQVTQNNHKFFIKKEKYNEGNNSLGQQNLQEVNQKIKNEEKNFNIPPLIQKARSASTQNDKKYSKIQKIFKIIVIFISIIIVFLTVCQKWQLFNNSWIRQISKVFFNLMSQLGKITMEQLIQKIQTSLEYLGEIEIGKSIKSIIIIKKSMNFIKRLLKYPFEVFSY